MRRFPHRFLLFSLVLVVGLMACDSDGGEVPPAPSEVEATAEDGAVALAWSPPSNGTVEGYNVYRSTNSFSSPGNAQQLTGNPISGTSYRDTDVENETTYHYRVTVVDASENESDLSGEASATPADRTAPGTPSQLEGRSENGAIALAWAAPGDKDVAGYAVYRSESSFSSTENAEKVNGDAPVDETSYTDGSTENGTTYYYRVAAEDEASNESALSNSVQKTPFPDPPSEP